MVNYHQLGLKSQFDRQPADSDIRDTTCIEMLFMKKFFNGGHIGVVEPTDPGRLVILSSTLTPCVVFCLERPMPETLTGT